MAWICVLSRRWGRRGHKHDAGLRLGEACTFRGPAAWLLSSSCNLPAMGHGQVTYLGFGKGKVSMYLGRA